MIAFAILAGSAGTQDKATEERIAELIGELKGDTTLTATVDELVELGEPAAQALLRVLQAEEQANKRQVLQVLGRMREQADRIAPTLFTISFDDLLPEALPALLRAFGDLAPYSLPQSAAAFRRLLAKHKEGGGGQDFSFAQEELKQLEHVLEQELGRSPWGTNLTITDSLSLLIDDNSSPEALPTLLRAVGRPAVPASLADRRLDSHIREVTPEVGAEIVNELIRAHSRATHSVASRLVITYYLSLDANMLGNSVGMIERMFQLDSHQVILQLELLGNLGTLAQSCLPVLGNTLAGPPLSLRAVRVRPEEIAKLQGKDADTWITAALRSWPVSQEIEVMSAVAQAMEKIAPGASATAMTTYTLLHDPVAKRRAHAAAELGGLGGEAAGVAPQLVHALGDRDTRVVAATISALGALGSTAEVAAPALTKLSVQGSTRIAALAEESLQKIVPVKNDLIELLASQFTSFDIEMKSAVSEALERIAPADSRTAVAVAHRLLRLDLEVDRRVNAARVLKGFGAEASEVAPQLVQALEDPDERVVVEAISAISAIGPGAREATASPLFKLTVDDDPQIAALAEEALQQVVPLKSELIELLASQFRSFDFGMQDAIAGAMESMGATDPRTVVAVAHRLLHDVDEDQRLDAAKTLIGFGPEAASVTREIASALDDPDQRVVLSAIAALTAIGPRASEAIPQLILTLYDQDAEMVIAAVSALGAIGSVSREATSAMVTLAAQKDARLAPAAKAALRQITSDAVKALDDSEERVVLETVSVLGTIGPDASEAIAPLLKLTYRRDSEIAKRAAVALRQIGPANNRLVGLMKYVGNVLW